MTPLTPENALVGMRVVCVRPSEYGRSLGFVAGEVYTILESPNGASVKVLGNKWWGNKHWFVLADPPATTLTPELLAALREEHAHWKIHDRDILSPRKQRLMNAIELAGILAPEPAKEPHNEPSGKDYDAWWFA